VFRARILKTRRGRKWRRTGKRRISRRGGRRRKRKIDKVNSKN
jgi:hypothetical protein